MIGMELATPGKARKIYKRFRIEDLDEQLSKMEFHRRVLDKIYGFKHGGKDWTVTRINGDHVHAVYQEQWKMHKGVGKLETMNGKGWSLTPEGAVSDRSRCYNCRTKIPKGAIRYVYLRERKKAWPYTREVLCVPCTIKKLEWADKQCRRQMGLMKRRLKPYRETMQREERLKKRLVGVKTNKEDKK